MAKAKMALNGYFLGSTLCKEELGILYAHLNQTEHSLPTLTVHAPLLRVYWLPLDQYRFVIQKKATPFTEALLGPYREKNFALVQLRIQSLLTNIEVRAKKGIVNTDSNLVRNFAFFGDTAVEIDFGNYAYSPWLLEGEKWREEQWRYKKRLRLFQQHYMPDLEVTW